MDPFQERMQRIEELLAALQEHGNPVVRASAVELVRALLDMHRAGLAEILARLEGQGGPGQAILNHLLQDDLVSRLLLLHGLHPIDLPTRLEHALQAVRPRLRALGAEVEVAEASHEAITLHVRGGSDVVHRLLEQAILAAAPDILRIKFVDADALASPLLPLPLVGES